MPLRLGIPLTLALAALSAYIARWVPANANPYYIVVGATAIWAAFDSRRLHVTRFESALALPPLGIMVALGILWPISFPWYLKLRHRIIRGTVPLRSNTRSLRWVFVLGGLVALAAIAIVLVFRSPGMKQLLDVAKAVSSAFGTPVNVSLTNRDALVLVVSGASIPTDSSAREPWAERIADTARAHYGHSDSIRSVTVIMNEVKQQGPVTVTRVLARYRFSYDSDAPEMPVTGAAECGASGGALSGNRVGNIWIGMGVEELRTRCPVARDSVELQEGVRQRRLIALVDGDTVRIDVVSDRITRVFVDSPHFRTWDSLGVGTSLSRLLAMRNVQAGFGEGRLFVFSDEACGLSFELDRATARSQDSRVSSKTLARARGSGKVVSVLVRGCK